MDVYGGDEGKGDGEGDRDEEGYRRGGKQENVGCWRRDSAEKSCGMQDDWVGDSGPPADCARLCALLLPCCCEKVVRRGGRREAKAESEQVTCLVGVSRQSSLSQSSDWVALSRAAPAMTAAGGEGEMDAFSSDSITAAGPEKCNRRREAALTAEAVGGGTTARLIDVSRSGDPSENDPFSLIVSPLANVSRLADASPSTGVCFAAWATAQTTSVAAAGGASYVWLRGGICVWKSGPHSENDPLEATRPPLTLPLRRATRRSASVPPCSPVDPVEPPVGSDMNVNSSLTSSAVGAAEGDRSDADGKGRDVGRHSGGSQSSTTLCSLARLGKASAASFLSHDLPGLSAPKVRDCVRRRPLNEREEGGSGTGGRGGKDSFERAMGERERGRGEGDDERTREEWGRGG